MLATDLNKEDILEIMERNVKRNEGVIKGSVSVRPLDITEDIRKYEEIVKFLYETNIVIAGDIVYDNEITEAFVNFITSVTESVPVYERHFYVAMEKRYVFTIDDLDTVAPACDFFLQKLEHLKNMPPVGYKVAGFEQIHPGFPQYFCYERVKEMLLFKISLIKIL